MTSTDRAGHDGSGRRVDIECDVAVFGSGAGGMTAAVVAACEGLKVVVFEKAAQIGGTTATSGGAIWIPGNSQARAAGTSDSIDDARRYLDLQITGPDGAQAAALKRDDLVNAYLASGPDAIDYLATHTDIRFELVRIPDYVTDLPGSVTEGRSLAPQAFDGSLLGDDFPLVLPPRRAFMVLGGLMVGRKEITMLLRPFASWNAFSHVGKLLLRHAWDRLRYPRGTRLLLGNALIARALHTAKRLGVRIETRSALSRLVVDGGRVAGAVVDGPDGEIVVRAKRGVVLAMGGFAHAAALRERLAPDHPHHHSLASPGNTGDAITAAEAVGAVVDRDLVSPGFWTPASIAREADGSETVFPYGHMDRGKPGAIIVDRSGRRFVNESDSYYQVVLAMYASGAIAPGNGAWIVCDRRFIRNYGLGLVRPYPFPLGPHLRNGYLMRGDTIAQLAARIDVDPAGLVDEIAKHNRFAHEGRDSDFHKGDSAYNRYNGDASVQPNPCLQPIDEAPFFAIRIVPCTLGTAVGLRTDADARVTDIDGRAIPGLYACGNDMASALRGTYAGPGITIGPAIVFAWRAMRHAAASAGSADLATSPISIAGGASQALPPGEASVTSLEKALP